MAFFHSPNIVTDGLVSLFDAADKTSYSGSIHGGVLSTWTDIAGSNNGTITNGPTFDSGNGGSLKFDGSNDYVDCGTAAIFPPFFAILSAPGAKVFFPNDLITSLLASTSRIPASAHGKTYCRV